MDMSLIGQRIRQAREEANLTRQGLGAAVGCTPKHIAAIERGEKMPKLDTFVDIVNAIGTSSDTLLQDLLEGTGDPLAGELAALVAPMPENIRKSFVKALRAFTESMR